MDEEYDVENSSAIKTARYKVREIIYFVRNNQKFDTIIQT